MPERVCVGVVVAAQGLQGQLRIKSFTARPGDIAAYGPVMNDEGRRFDLKLQGERGQGVGLASLAGVTDRNAAEALRGTQLYVLRAALPPPDDEGEFYWSDLIGLAVVFDDGEAAGTVQAVHDFGAGSILEVTRPGATSVMVPFTRAVVPVVDLPGKRVVVTRACGVFEDEPVEGNPLKETRRTREDGAE
ncbi:MAG: 16S rRNA processing protein RimM [Alphaproteobacteria bacterium]|nr:16S rRNA processing protein RimM [Alphaproteobacteria bacterium]